MSTTTLNQSHLLLFYGIALCIFSIIGIVFWVNPTMERTMNMVDEMVKDWAIETDCNRLLMMKEVVENNPLASSQRPDMKLTLEKRIIELGCMK